MRTSPVRLTLLAAAREPKTEPAAEQVFPAARADTGLVVQVLRIAGVVLIRDRQGELGHIRRRRDALVNAIRSVPGAIAADNQPLHRSFPRVLRASLRKVPEDESSGRMRT